MVIRRYKEKITSHFSIENVFIISCMFIILVNPIYHVHITKKISLDTPVDPEYINGIITVSSILFGFSSIFIFQLPRDNTKLWYLLIFPIILIGLTGASMWNVVIGVYKPMIALIYAWTSLNASVFVAAFLVGQYAHMRKNHNK